MSHNNSDIPPDKTPEQIVMEGLGRLHDEITCAEEHFNNRDFGGLTMHLTNAAYGCQILSQVLVTHLLDQDTIIDLMRSKLQEKIGAPVEFIGKAGEMLGFHVINVEAPDDISGLET